MKGKFITFEGCEGVGKSKQMSILKDYFNNHNIDYIFTREPGGDNISEQIRNVVLSGKNSNISDECEALLYASSRAQHVKEVILPALEEGKIVLCDRYIDSSFAYQGFARGLGLEFVESINIYAMQNAMPDLTLFLNLSPEQAFKRKGGVDKNDRMEQSGKEFHNKVYEGYLQLLKKYPHRIESIDCRFAIGQTHSNIINALKKKGVI